MSRTCRNELDQETSAMKLDSREYKVMIDQGPFVDRPSALKALRKSLAKLVKATTDVTLMGDFNVETQREIIFLDTPEKDFRGDEFVLRRRFEDGKAEYTLKRRSEDRSSAAGADLSTVEGFRPDEKFEEDIAPPFFVRFSHSNTVRPPKKTPLRQGELPRTLAEAAAFFPILGSVRHEGREMPPDTALQIVNGITAFERVWTGLTLHFLNGEVESSVALILWTDGETGPPLVAEFSFRLKNDGEDFSEELSESAKLFFESIQTLDEARPNGTTKTGFIYRDQDGD
jgi:hypothetical protein